MCATTAVCVLTVAGSRCWSCLRGWQLAGGTDSRAESENWSARVASGPGWLADAAVAMEFGDAPVVSGRRLRRIGDIRRSRRLCHRSRVAVAGQGGRSLVARPV